ITPRESIAQHCEWRKKTMRISGFVFLEDLFRRGLAKVQAAEKVLVAGRHHIVLFLFLHVLNVGFSQRMETLDVINEGMLPLDHAVHHTIEGDGREDREIGVLRDAVIAVDAYRVVRTPYGHLAYRSCHRKRGARLARLDGNARGSLGR